MNTNMKTHFWGASIEVRPLGLSHVNLTRFGEEYVVIRPVSTCHNLIFGDMYIEHSGKLVCEKLIQNDQSVPVDQRLSLVLDFKKAGWSKSNWAVVEGQMPVRPGSQKMWKIRGKWTESMSAFNEETGEDILLWRANDLPEQSD
jgi:oxysterol-binding protein 1